MLLLVLSDLHLGKGRYLKNGQVNILEDFFEDDRFYEFVDYYSSGRYYLQNVHIVLNGDILNLIQIDIDGIFTHIIDEDHTVNALNKIHKGHKAFFEGIKLFLSRPNKKLTYIIGNHDAGADFKKFQKRFNEIVSGEVEFCFNKNIHNIHIEHGHRFEVVNTVPPKSYYIDGPFGKKILNLPWGSLFCIWILPILKKDRPHIDKVRPMNSYIKWTLIHDFLFFIKMFRIVLNYFFRTQFDEYTKQNRNFKTTIKLLKQITIFPKYARMAKKILKKNPSLHTVIMGHTHVKEWRRFPGNKYYFNTGTWNPIPSVDAAQFEDNTKLTYAFIEVDSKSESIIKASLNTWQGQWRPFTQEISTGNDSK